MPFTLKDFASMSMEAVHVVDFSSRSFHFVANRDFFLYGHTVEEVLSLGYDFLPKIVHNKDFLRLKDIYASILQHDKLDEINYFSFAIRIKNEIANYIMVDHKLKPLFIDGQLRFGLCLLSSSVLEKPGHLQAHYHNSTDYDEYSPKDKKWKRKKVKPLSKREKTVLILAKQGKSNQQIADIICAEHQTVRNILTSIYRKLNVNSITQAIILATSRHLIYAPEQHKCNNSTEKQKHNKQRRPITKKKLLLIQEELNNGKSVNSIAKQMNIAESTIRYHINTGKFKKIREQSNSQIETK